MSLTFIIIKKTIGLRVTREEELIGLDKLEHGLNSAYAGFALETEALSIEDNLQLMEVEREQPVLEKTNMENKLSRKSSHISKVVIITKPEKIDTLKKVFDEIGITGMTVTRVNGCGVQKGQLTYYRGAKVNMELLPKIKVEVVVSQVPVDRVVDAVKQALYTGNVGDGKIFVYDVENVIRVSTGSEGMTALQYED